MGIGSGAGAAAVPAVAEGRAAEDGEFVPEPDDEGKAVEPGSQPDDVKEIVAEDGTAFHHMATLTPAAVEGARDENGREANRFATPLSREAGYNDANPDEVVKPTEEVEETAATAASTTTPVKDDEHTITTTTSPLSPTKSNSKVKTWFKSRFRSGSKSQKDAEDKPTISADSVPATEDAGQPIPEEEESDSMRDVAMAGKTPTIETDDMYGASEKDAAVSPVREDAADGEVAEHAGSRSPSISPASSLYSKDVNKQIPATEPDVPDPARSTSSSEPPRGRRGFKERILEKITSSKEPHSGQGQAATKPDEEDEFDEARDTFEEEKLAPPPKVSTMTGDDSKPLSPKSSREGSKFKEEL